VASDEAQVPALGRSVMIELAEHAAKRLLAGVPPPISWTAG
jgi:hypothetical protein